MYRFEDICSPGKCAVCGAETDVVVVCSVLGAFSHAYCRDCHSNRYEPYQDMLSTMYCIGNYPDDLALPLRDIFRRSIERAGKTEAEFNEDVKKFSAWMDEQMEADMAARSASNNRDEEFLPFG